MTRRKKRSVAAPRRARPLIEIAGQCLDAFWDREGVTPSLVIVCEAPDSGIVAVRVDDIDDGLARLERVAPATAEMARTADRLRRLVSADGVAVLLPRHGQPCACVVGRRGRYLADEALDDLTHLAVNATHIAAGGDA
ncbi:MAG: hypothetical protein WKG00_17810 [Polyangiaceae bacterium]